MDELAELRAQLRESEQRLARMPALEREAELAADDRRELDELRARHRALEEQLEQALAREAELAAAVEHTGRVIDDMTNSLSWRLTAPLRRLKRRR